MTFHLGRLTRRTVFRFLAFAAGSLALAGGVHAQGNIDTDQQVATPVPHRYIHGRLGDAEFQIALPDNWNGKLLIGARGFSGDEFASGAFKTVGLQKGYAYALSDQGWYRFDIVDHPEDKYFESRRRILQLTQVHEVGRQPPLRQDRVAHVHGGRLERRPQHQDDGRGLSGRVRRRRRRLRHHVAPRVDGLAHAVPAQLRRHRAAHRRHHRQAHRRRRTGIRTPSR